MKRRIEKEYTYYMNSSQELVPRAVLQNIINQLCDDANLIPQIKFNCLLEFRFASDADNKKKISFKINHGEIYYKVTQKTRLSSIDSDLQIYDERISAWHHISELDPSSINNDVISYYYKESYKYEISLGQGRYKLNLQDITFLDSTNQDSDRVYYLEIENKKMDDNTLVKILANLEAAGWMKLTDSSSKVSIGAVTLPESYCLSHDLHLVKKQVYSVFKKMAIRSMS